MIEPDQVPKCFFCSKNAFQKHGCFFQSILKGGIIEEAKKNNTVTPNFLTKFLRYHFVRQGPQKSFTSSFWTWTW